MKTTPAVSLCYCSYVVLHASCPACFWNLQLLCIGWLYIVEGKHFPKCSMHCTSEAMVLFSLQFCSIQFVHLNVGVSFSTKMKNVGVSFSTKMTKILVKFAELIINVIFIQILPSVLQPKYHFGFLHGLRQQPIYFLHPKYTCMDELSA